MNLGNIKKIYFIGIKGVAMSGLAVICKQRGMKVAGSDVSEKFITDKVLEKENIKVYQNFSEKNLEEFNPELVVVGTSWNADHVEVKYAKQKNIKSISDSELRGILSKEKKTIAITGVHGKTTTTALMAHILQTANLKPSYLIGTGSVPNLDSNAAWQDGEHFVVEGDEYSRSAEDKTPKFLDLDPSISMITSLEWEHVDVYPSLEAIEEVFKKLISKTKDLVVACGDWPSVQSITKDAVSVVTYGVDKNNLWQIEDIKITESGTEFSVRSASWRKNKKIEDFSVSLFGEHYALNALGCIIVALELGVEVDIIKNALESFKGAERRFDIIKKDDIIFIDDYGHHPTEIQVTLKAISQKYKDQKIYCVFQPHMVSRTKVLLDEFAKSFSDATQVLVTDIFKSAREKDESITSQDLVEKIQNNHEDVIHSGDLNQTSEYIKKNISEGVVVTMGAGDVYEVRDNLIK